MADKNSFAELVQYFKTLASQHVCINAFYRFELDEVLTSLRDVEIPCLIMEGYKFNFTDNRSDNILKTRSGAFILLDHVSDIGDFDEIHSTWDKLEIIGDDILARIKADKNKTGTPVKSFPIENVEAHLLATDIGNFYGIRFTFDILCKFNSTVNDSVWEIPVS